MTVTIGLQLDLGRLHQLPRTEMVEDFHCVTTWTIPQLTWAGWKFADVWEQLIEHQMPPPIPKPPMFGYGALTAIGPSSISKTPFGSEVMLADSLKGRPLDAAPRSSPPSGQSPANTPIRASST